MANFRYIEPAVKQLLVQQAARHRPSRVASNLDIHRSTVHKVVRYWKETGSVRQAILGRPRTLGALDCLVSRILQHRNGHACRSRSFRYLVSSWRDASSDDATIRCKNCRRCSPLLEGLLSRKRRSFERFIGGDFRANVSRERQWRGARKRESASNFLPARMHRKLLFLSMSLPTTGMYLEGCMAGHPLGLVPGGETASFEARGTLARRIYLFEH